MGIYGDLEFPEEARPGELITYKLTVTAYEDIYVEYFTITIYYGGGELYKEIVISDKYMRKHDRISKIILLKMPETEERLHCIIDVETSMGIPFWITFTVHSGNHFCTTYIRKMTYVELLAEYEKRKAEYEKLKLIYDGLKADYDKLLTDYGKLKADYGKLRTEYDGLKVTYDKLTVDYGRLKADYDGLKVTYDKLTVDYDKLKGELATNTSLMYLFIVTTIAFVATTVYFARRKPKAA